MFVKSESDGHILTIQVYDIITLIFIIRFNRKKFHLFIIRVIYAFTFTFINKDWDNKGYEKFKHLIMNIEFNHLYIVYVNKKVLLHNKYLIVLSIQLLLFLKT